MIFLFILITILLGYLAEQMCIRYPAESISILTILLSFIRFASENAITQHGLTLASLFVDPRIPRKI